MEEEKSEHKPKQRHSKSKLETHLGSLLAETEATESKLAAFRPKLSREREESRYG